MAKKRSRKIVKYRKPLQLNIGVVVFAIIFLYLLYYIFTYLTTEHTSVYEVKQGTIAQDTVLQGLALREETVYSAQDEGYLNYYCQEGTKTSAGSYICSVDESGEYYRQLAAAMENEPDDASYDRLAEVAAGYVSAYSDMDFAQVYQFKYDLEAALLEALTTGMTDLGSGGTASGAGLHAYRAETAGIVVYHADGLEAETVDTFTADMLDSSAYPKQSFLKQETVSAGDGVYKLITSEIWQLVVPVSEALASSLKEDENIQVEFKKDGTTAWAAPKILSREDGSYLVLEFNNSMVRFATERYLEVELLIGDTSGLKIPNSAITTKTFLTVPKDYITKGGDSNSNGLLIERTGKNGETTVEFVAASPFYETEDCYYIDAEGISRNDIAVKPNSTERYTLEATAALEGVYNINKGYAVFKRIERLFENEEYTIVKSGTSYGIALYDHIALDSSSIAENEVIR